MWSHGVSWEFMGDFQIGHSPPCNPMGMSWGHMGNDGKYAWRSGKPWNPMGKIVNPMGKIMNPMGKIMKPMGMSWGHMGHDGEYAWCSGNMLNTCTPYYMSWNFYEYTMGCACGMLLEYGTFWEREQFSNPLVDT